MDSLSQFFAYEHLPPHLQEVSKPFAQLAEHLLQSLPSNPERTTAMRKLLEAKDCAVRAKLFKGAPAADPHAAVSAASPSGFRCRGCYQLGSACGQCDKCQADKEQMRQKGYFQVLDELKHLDEKLLSSVIASVFGR